jgi:Kelch motif protein
LRPQIAEARTKLGQVEPARVLPRIRAVGRAARRLDLEHLDLEGRVPGGVRRGRSVRRVVPNAAGQSIVYTFGGTDDMGGSCVSIETYNVATNTWARLGFEPKVCGSEMNGVGRIGSTLYFLGGRIHTGDGVLIQRTAWAFDAGAKTLTRKADMPRGTARCVTGVIDGKVYVLPGICSTDFWPQAEYCEHEASRGGGPPE